MDRKGWQGRSRTLRGIAAMQSGPPGLPAARLGHADVPRRMGYTSTTAQKATRHRVGSVNLLHRHRCYAEVVIASTALPGLELTVGLRTCQSLAEVFGWR